MINLFYIASDEANVKYKVWEFEIGSYRTTTSNGLLSIFSANIRYRESIIPTWYNLQRIYTCTQPNLEKHETSLELMWAQVRNQLHHHSPYL